MDWDCRGYAHGPGMSERVWGADEEMAAMAPYSLISAELFDLRNSTFIR